MSLAARMANQERHDRLRQKRLGETSKAMLGFAEREAAAKEGEGASGGMLMVGLVVVVFLGGVYWYTKPDDLAQDEVF